MYQEKRSKQPEAEKGACGRSSFKLSCYANVLHTQTWHSGITLDIIFIPKLSYAG